MDITHDNVCSSMLSCFYSHLLSTGRPISSCILYLLFYILMYSKTGSDFLSPHKLIIQFSCVLLYTRSGSSDHKIKLFYSHFSVQLFFRTGGSLLVTDLSRQQSLFDISPRCKQIFTNSSEREGSNLGHVISVCCWEEEADSSLRYRSNTVSTNKSCCLVLATYYSTV